MKLKACCNSPNVQINRNQIMDMMTGDAFIGHYLKCKSCNRFGNGFRPMENGLPDLPNLEQDWNK